MELKKEEKLAGLYRISVLGTEDTYIGGTLNLYKRRRTHYKDLKSKRHHNCRLQAAYDTYGESSICFEVLCILEQDKEFVSEMEVKAFGVYKPTLNIATWSSGIGGDSAAKRVAQYSLSGELIGVYGSMSSTASALGLEGGVSTVAINKGWLIGGYQWVLLEKDEAPANTISEFDLKPSSDGYDSGEWRRFWNRADYIVYQWDLKGSLVRTWDDLTDIVEETDGDLESLREHIQGRRGSYFKHVYTLTNESPPEYVQGKGLYNKRSVKLTSIKSGEVLEYKSISLAERELGLSKDSLRRASKTTGKIRGYKIELSTPWEFDPENTWQTRLTKLPT